MIVVGLTGGIGSGKSTVSQRLVDRGAVLIDADAIVKELQLPGQPLLRKLAEAFGDDVLDASGALDRQALADRAFGDPAKVKQLNAIMHPAVYTELLDRLDAQRGTDAIVVLDIPLLLRDGRYPIEAIVVVDVPTEVAIDRLVRFRNLREDDARSRIARQITREERLSMADMVIDNSGTPADLDPQIDALWEWISTLPEAPVEPPERVPLKLQ
ncbi:MAG: dephospho-CoA kinase [Acidimicrobiia bacterium]